jgi:phage terminase large subunit GpA-like protein
MERWCSECPHCGEYHNIVFADIRFEYEEQIIAGEKTVRVKDVWYVCPDCGCICAEREMKKQPAKWIAENPDAYEQGVRSFWLNAFVSPWVTWESIILDYLNAVGNSRKLQVIYNTRFGELWEDRGDLEDEDSLLARREDYGTRVDGAPVDLPDGVLVLTCGVDTQDDRLEYEIVGFGHFGENWGIKKGIVMGRPDDPQVWAVLDDVINGVYRFSCGVGLRVSLTFIDEGGHFTQEVRLQCRARLGRKVFAIKGFFGDGVPLTSPPKKQKIVDSKKRQIGTCWRYSLGVDAGKQIITDNLHVQTPGAKYCHFPKRDDYGAAYFKGLLSERLVYKPDRKNPWQWEKIPGHERNEALDCRNYALAAFKALTVDLDAIDRRLKAAKNRQRDSNELPDAPVPTKSAVRKTGAGNTGSGAVKKYYDDW